MEQGRIEPNVNLNPAISAKRAFLKILFPGNLSDLESLNFMNYTKQLTQTTIELYNGRKFSFYTIQEKRKNLFETILVDVPRILLSIRRTVEFHFKQADLSEDEKESIEQSEIASFKLVLKNLLSDKGLNWCVEFGCFEAK
jgi:hypothetical protein